MKPTVRILLLLVSISGTVGCVSKPTLEMFQTGDSPCYDRSAQPQTPVVDAHVHFRPFGGAAIPFEEMVSYFEETDVLFANIYGIGQMPPLTSPCTYYLDCPGTPVRPTLKNDFVNATNYITKAPPNVHLTLSMTFPDLSRPGSILPRMQILEQEFPGAFTWVGEVNLVKQALFPNGHEPVPMAKLAEWAPFMETLRERSIPLAIHADLGNDKNPTEYLPLMKEVLRLYPGNPIVWMHMGLSRELVDMSAVQHIKIMASLLDRHPNLMLDISWRVIDNHYFSKPGKRALYVSFLNNYSKRILPGTDFLASRDKNIDVYRTELQVTSRILRDLNDFAFRNIALGLNYFQLLGLDYTAPPVCASW